MKFLVFDLNRDACNDALSFKEDFMSHADLFALSRLYCVTFAVQSELTWIDFLERACCRASHSC